MRVLFLSPGDLEAQLKRLPLAAAIGRDLKTSIQVACPLAAAPLWKLLPVVEKQLPFEFEGVTLADWANLLGCVREPDFQACLNFASGWNLDLLLSLSHIPVRVARGGFSCTAPVAADAPAEAFLKPLGLQSDQEQVCISLPPKALEQARSKQPTGDGPHEQPHEIKEPGKPNHHTNDVEGFEPQITLRWKAQGHQAAGD